MKVLLFTRDFEPNSGGISVFLHNLCFQLSRKGHSIDILTDCNVKINSCERNPPYRVFRYSVPAVFSSLVPIMRTMVLYYRQKYNLIFVGHITGTHSLGIWLVNKLFGVPVVVLSHGNDLRYSKRTFFDRIAVGLLLKSVSLLLCNSGFTARLARDMNMHCLIKIITPGVDGKQFNPDINTLKVTRKYRLDNHKVLLTASRLVPKKNVKSVIYALEKVVAKIPDVLFLVVGDGEEKKELEKLSERLGLKRNICFMGFIKNDLLASFYCASDVFVMPSKEDSYTGDIETFGISYLEANACGKPVIAGRSGGVADAVVDNETGILVDPYDVDDIAKAIIRLLGNNEYACRLGRNGRRRIEQEFDWEIIGKKFEKTLAEIVYIKSKQKNTEGKKNGYS